MHDAIRGDVQGALIAAGRPDHAQHGSGANRYLSELWELFAVDIRSIRALAPPAGFQNTLAEVESEFREYIDVARAVVDASRQRPSAAEAKMADFSRRFEAIEAHNEAVSEKIQIFAGLVRIAAYGRVGKAGWGAARLRLPALCFRLCHDSVHRFHAGNIA